MFFFLDIFFCVGALSCNQFNQKSSFIPDPTRGLLPTGKIVFPLSLRVKYFGVSPFFAFNFSTGYFQWWSFRQFQRSPKK